MKPRLLNTWHNLHTSFWFVPAVMVAGSAVLAMGAVRVDRLYGSGLGSVAGLWSGTADGARSVLSTIASAMITVAGVTFSVTVVALTMAASQFGPRILRNFMRDTGNQVVLGTFVSTFLYCLLVMRTVRSGGEHEFVPHLSATLALVLAGLSVAVLVYFIHHVSSSLQVESLVSSIAAELQDTIDHLFPEDLGHTLPPDEAAAAQEPDPGEPAWYVCAPSTGYLQVVDDDGIMDLATRHGLVVRLLYRPGSFISEHTPVLEVRPASREDAGLAAALSRMLWLGRYRTTTQDVEYPAQQIVSIALRALSPGINDPLTATVCIDWIGSALMRMAMRRIPSHLRSDDRGRLRVIAAPTTFAELADLTFNPIRRAAASHPPVLQRLLERLYALSMRVQRAEDRRAVGDHARRIRELARESGFSDREMDTIERTYGFISERLQGGRAGGGGRPHGELGSDTT